MILLPQKQEIELEKPVILIDFFLRCFLRMRSEKASNTVTKSEQVRLCFAAFWLAGATLPDTNAEEVVEGDGTEDVEDDVNPDQPKIPPAIVVVHAQLG